MHVGSDPNLPLRLAHSHREKAQALIQDCSRALADGSIDKRKFDALVAEYHNELSVAEAAVERFRGLDRTHVDTLKADLRLVRQEQARLPELAAAGKLSARQANDRNRELAERLAELDSQLAMLSKRLQAQTAEELGGYVDLPFDRYAEKTAALAPTVAREEPATNAVPKRWEFAVTLLAAAVASVAVFLPWFTFGDESLALHRADLAAGVSGAQGTAAGAGRLVWILYLVTPWLGVVLLLRGGKRMMGWGVLAVGLVLLAGATLPGVLVGASRVYTESFSQVLAAYRGGALLFAAASTVYIFVGALRVSPWTDSLAHSLLVSAVLAAGVAAVCMLVALLIYLSPATGRVEFDAAVTAPAQDTVTVTCRNMGDEPVYLVVPWPDGGLGRLKGFSKRATYGIRVYVRERANEEFRLLPLSPQIWRMPDAPVLSGDFIHVVPGMSQQVLLDLRQVSVLGADAERVRLDISRGDGAYAGSFETDLGGHYLSPQAEPREPAVVPRPATIPTAPPELVIEEDRLEADASTRTVAAMHRLAFTGVVGNRAAFRITAGEGGEETRLVGVGETIVEDWYLDSISRSPSAITVRQDPGGATATILRGQSFDYSAGR